MVLTLFPFAYLRNTSTALYLIHIDLWHVVNQFVGSYLKFSGLEQLWGTYILWYIVMEEGKGRNSGQSGSRNGPPQKVRMKILSVSVQLLLMWLFSLWNLDSAINSCAIMWFANTIIKFLKETKWIP